MIDRLSPRRQAALQKRLLRATLKYVVSNIPFYRNLFTCDASCLRLSNFPIVSKDFMDVNIHHLLNLDYLPEITLTTGGTTRNPSATFQTRVEMDRMIEYGYGLRPGERYPDTFDRFTLHVGIVGPSVIGPRGRPLLSLPLTKQGQFPLIQRVLAEGMPVRGRRRMVGAVICPAQELKLLTQLLDNAGFDPKPLRLDVILAYSDYITKRWRDRLEAFWGCVVRPVYGLSEFSYAATAPCLNCGHYHFPPYVYPEVVHPKSRKPLDSVGNDGVLVLTSLYPFVRAHPHIRYWTGDVVRIGPLCSTFLEHGVHFMGRIEHTALVEEDGLARCVLSPFDILETADHVPDVAYVNSYPMLEQQLPIGAPILYVSPSNGRGGRVKLSILVGSTEKVHAMVATRSWIRRLLQINPSLEGNLRSGRLIIDVVNKSPEEVQHMPGYVPI